MTIGIYRLTFPNRKTYIGSSTNIEKRIWNHRDGMKSERHPNRALISVYRKYQSFEVEILQKIRQSTYDKNHQKLLDLEQKWIDQEEPELNSTLDCVAPSRDPKVAAKISKTMQGRKMSKAVRDKIRATLTGRKRSAEECAAIARGKMGNKCGVGNKNMLGKKHSKETKAQMSASMKKKWKDPNYGRKKRA